jgi:hypothetical protein
MTNEDQFWADKAALLDPACYQYTRANSFDLSFPDTVYVINMMRGETPGKPAGRQWYHRVADADSAMMIPAGHRLYNQAGDYPDIGFVYYARPSLVQGSDARYQTDPKGLYYERLMRLRSLELNIINGYVQQAWAAGTPFSGDTVAFPTDFERGLLVHVSNLNASWLAICSKDGAGAFQNIINLDDELDDIRPMRFTKSVLLPFNRATFPQMFVGHSSMHWTDANPNDPILPVFPGAQTYPAEGALHYYKLPSDW